MSKQIGYARVRTTHQATDRQVATLKDAGCEVVYNEVISTRTSEGDRPQLQACLASLNEGDELVITTLSRLGRAQHEVSKENERYLREMLSKNSLYGTMQNIVDRAITNF